MFEVGISHVEQQLAVRKRNDLGSTKGILLLYIKYYQNLSKMANMALSTKEKEVTPLFQNFKTPNHE